MLRVGDRMKTLPAKSLTDEANKLYAHREAVITDIRSPFGLHTQYIVEFVEPITHLGYTISGNFYYDFDNALELVG